MRAFTTAPALSLLAAVNAEVFNVSVGFNNSLTYQPESVTGKEGDVIIFHFVSRNHTVTQSTFANPCDALASGADSGFLPAASTSHPTFNFTVSNSSDWFFCAQADHCVEGMVFAVNPTAEMSFGAFQAKAKGLNPNNTSPSYTPYGPTTSIGPSSDVHSSTASVSNPSTESTSTSAPAESTSHSKIGPAIGGIVGGMIAISIAIFILFWMRRRARRGDSDTVAIDPSLNILVSDFGRISIVGASHRPSSTVIGSDPNILVSNADRIPIVGTINRLSSQKPSNAPSGSSQNPVVDQPPQYHDTSASPHLSFTVPSTLPLLQPPSGRHSTSTAPNPRSASDSALAAEEAHFLRRLYDRNAPADEIGELLRSMRAREFGMAASSRDAARGSAPPPYNLSG